MCVCFPEDSISCRAVVNSCELPDVVLVTDLKSSGRAASTLVNHISRPDNTSLKHQTVCCMLNLHMNKGCLKSQAQLPLLLGKLPPEWVPGSRRQSGSQDAALISSHQIKGVGIQIESKFPDGEKGRWDG